MKRTSILILTAFLLFSCTNKQNPEDQKKHLSGYWEIKEATTPHGNKSYDLNFVVDYIEIDGSNGTRTKVSPQMDGSYVTNGMTENFTLKIENDTLFMLYTTDFDQWKEAVIEAKDSILVVKNEDNKIYTYKKYHNESLIPAVHE